MSEYGTEKEALAASPAWTDPGKVSRINENELFLRIRRAILAIIEQPAGKEPNVRTEAFILEQHCRLIRETKKFAEENV